MKKVNLYVDGKYWKRFPLKKRTVSHRVYLTKEDILSFVKKDELDSSSREKKIIPKTFWENIEI